MTSTHDSRQWPAPEPGTTAAYVYVALDGRRNANMLPFFAAEQDNGCITGNMNYRPDRRHAD